jgi:PPOX class probable F420-dependent enzyme
MTEEQASGLLAAQQFGVLATVRRSGHPHLSTVLYGWDPVERIVRISSTATRLKVRQIRHDPLTALHVTGTTAWSFAVAEATAEVSEETTVRGDSTGQELLTMTPGFADPAAEAEFLQQLVDERRVVIRLRVTRLYGASLDVSGVEVAAGVGVGH